jgi:hypothetical protein
MGSGRRWLGSRLSQISECRPQAIVTVAAQSDWYFRAIEAQTLGGDHLGTKHLARAVGLLRSVTLLELR